MFTEQRMNKSLFKHNDRGLVGEVLNYITSHNLSVELVGSATSGEKTYNDIDLKVSGDRSKYELNDRYNAIMTLARAFAENQKPEITTTDKPEGQQKVPGFAKFITNYSQKDQLYVDTKIDNRFTIHRPSTKTTIDLCFEKEF